MPPVLKNFKSLKSNQNVKMFKNIKNLWDNT